jgi:hypothetical protein
MARDGGGIFSSISIPSPTQIVQDIQDWVKTQGVWWATSVTAHAVGISALLLLGTYAAEIIDEAPKFEAVQTEIPDPEPIEHFEVGETPYDPTELDTDSLSLTEAPEPMAVEEQINTTEADPFEEAGGGMAATENAISLGGLGGFDVKAVGPGAKVRGAGGVGVGVGTGTNAGSGGAGSGFGGRGSGVRKAMLGAYGGTKGSERAVAAALNWFARHQNPDGSWTLANHTRMCKDGTCAGVGSKAHDGAGTPFALLAFLGAGQTHKSKGPYKNTIFRGLYHLASQQKNDGSLLLGSNLYTHGLATIVLTEAYGMTGDKQIGAAAQQAINYIVMAQDPAGGGWRYTPKQPGDTSAVGWQVMALKSGIMSGLSVPSDTMANAAKFLNAVGDGSGGFGYTDKGRGLATSAVGLLCVQYMGAPKNSPIIEGGVKYLMANTPDKHKDNCYYYYYATQVMHHIPGSEWDVWNRIMRKQLIDTQVKEGCAAGSWNPSAGGHGDSGGRIMSTALNCLTLEVYYRHLPLYQVGGKK